MTALLTASRLKAARACKRLHHLEYDLGYRPVRDAAELAFGTLIHKALEAWWRAMQAGLPQEAWLELALAAINEEADPFERAKARVMMLGYHLRWKDEPYEVLAVEERFEMQLINPATGAASKTWRLGGKIDVIVRDQRTGEIVVIEHKTSSEDITQGSEYWRRLTMDSQVSTYFDGAAAALGRPVDRCIYDVLFKPLLRPSQVPVLDENGVKIVRDASGARVRTKDGKKWRETASTADGFVLETRDETPEEFELRLTEAVAAAPEKHFARGNVVRLDGELDEHRFDIWSTALEVRAGQVAQRFPRNPDACTRFGRTCPFFDACTGITTLEDTTRFTKLDDVHPELAGDGGDEAPKEEASAP